MRYRVRRRTVKSWGSQEQHSVTPAAWNARLGKTLNQFGSPNKCGCRLENLGRNLALQIMQVLSGG